MPNQTTPSLLAQAVAKTAATPLGYADVQRSQYLADALASLGQTGGQNLRTPMALGSNLLAEALLQFGRSRNDQALRGDLANNQTQELNAGLLPGEVAVPSVSPAQSPNGGGLIGRIADGVGQMFDQNPDSGSTAITPNDGTGGLGGAVDPGTGQPSPSAVAGPTGQGLSIGGSVGGSPPKPQSAAPAPSSSAPSDTDHHIALALAGAQTGPAPTAAQSGLAAALAAQTQADAANMVYGEARGEPAAGRQAVVGVAQNRALLEALTAADGTGGLSGGPGGNIDAASGQAFPMESPLSQVIREPGQFEGFNPNRQLNPNSSIYRSIMADIMPQLDGSQPNAAGNADHFWSPGAQAADGRQPPAWAGQGSPQTIGNQQFSAIGYGGQPPLQSPAGGPQLAAAGPPGAPAPPPAAGGAGGAPAGGQPYQVASIGQTPPPPRNAPIAQPQGPSGPAPMLAPQQGGAPQGPVAPPAPGGQGGGLQSGQPPSPRQIGTPAPIQPWQLQRAAELRAQAQANPRLIPAYQAFHDQLVQQAQTPEPMEISRPNDAGQITLTGKISGEQWIKQPNGAIVSAGPRMIVGQGPNGRPAASPVAGTQWVDVPGGSPNAVHQVNQATGEERFVQNPAYGAVGSNMALGSDGQLHPVGLGAPAGANGSNGPAGTPDPRAPIPPALLGQATDLAEKFRNGKGYTDYVNSVNAANAFEANIKAFTGNNSVLDQAGTDNAIRAMSGLSARQGSVNSLLDHLSLPDELKGQISKTMGGGFITPQVLLQMRDMVHAYAEGHAPLAQQEYDQYNGMARRGGFDLGLTLPTVSPKSPVSWGPPGPGAAPPPINPGSLSAADKAAIAAEARKRGIIR